MFLTKARAILVALATAAILAAASLLPAASQAYTTVRPIGVAEASICYHENKAYSEGDEIQAPDGTLLYCHNGEWVRPGSRHLAPNHKKRHP